MYSIKRKNYSVYDAIKENIEFLNSASVDGISIVRDSIRIPVNGIKLISQGFNSKYNFELVSGDEINIPAKNNTVHMLDLGANITNDPEQLFQFALMGSIVASDICEIENPRVALLNIGAEDLKGNETVKNAANLLSSSSLNYIGYVEGDEIFSGKTDVVVTDGFTGNVALKSIEGSVDFVIGSLKEAFNINLLTKLQALLSKSLLTQLSRKIDSRKYNGASLVGLDGIVIKSHGGADAFSFHHAIETAVIEVKNQVPDQIRGLLQRESL